jgi:hypothetical protein
MSVLKLNILKFWLSLLDGPMLTSADPLPDPAALETAA